MGSTVKYRKFILPIVVGLIIWALTPIKPDALNDQAWYMFAIFVSTIIACITQPMTIGAVSIIGFTIMILVGIVDTKLGHILEPNGRPLGSRICPNFISNLEEKA
ncbi:hypothetical protein HpBTM60_35030 [Helicobacter pylori]